MGSESRNEVWEWGRVFIQRGGELNEWMNIGER